MSFILFRVYELPDSSRNESPNSTRQVSTYIEVPSPIQAGRFACGDFLLSSRLAYNVGMSNLASPSPADIIVVLMTAPNGDVAAQIARPLIEEGLVACVNIVPGLRSIYRWEGKLCDEAEVLCLCKTRASLFEMVRDRIASLHPYSVPEIIAVPLAQGSAAYLAWVAQSTTTEADQST
jgi:periplasmic divalent cation tolerance protein